MSDIYYITLPILGVALTVYLLRLLFTWLDSREKGTPEEWGE